MAAVTPQLKEQLRAAVKAGRELDVRDAADRHVDAQWIAEILLSEHDADRRALKLRGAEVVGPLTLEAATLPPLVFLECRFEAAIDLSESIAPSVRFLSCDIASLSANQLRTRGDLAVTGCIVRDELELLGAHVGGSLRLTASALSSSNGRALYAAGVQIEESLLIGASGEHRFVADGEIRILAARVGGQVSFAGALLSNPGGVTLQADGIRVEGDVFCVGTEEHPFESEGQIRLVGAEIGGQLSFSGARVEVGEGLALHADSARVVQGMFCHPGHGRRFTAQGAIRIVGAHVGSLALSGAALTGAADAVVADRVRVDQNVSCHSWAGDRFESEGALRFPGARIEGQLGFDDAKLGGRPLALDLDEAAVTSLWLRFAERPPGVIGLRRARISRLYDRTYGDARAWPRVALDGCSYDSLTADEPIHVRQRLSWLEGDPDEYSPHPYEQLAAWYRRSGHDDNARDVAIAKQKRRRKTLGFRAKLWSLFLGATVAHGYRPSQALFWLAGLLVGGGVVFGEVYDADDPARAGSDVTPAKDDPAPFQPFIYTLDLLVPVISLGQRISWNAHGSAQWVGLGLTVFGWLLTAALLGGVAARRQ